MPEIGNKRCLEAAQVSPGFVLCSMFVIRLGLRRSRSYLRTHQ